MAFKMGDEVLNYQDNCLLADQEACKLFLLEDASVPEEELAVLKPPGGRGEECGDLHHSVSLHELGQGAGPHRPPSTHAARTARLTRPTISSNW